MCASNPSDVIDLAAAWTESSGGAAQRNKGVKSSAASFLIFETFAKYRAADESRPRRGLQLVSVAPGSAFREILETQNHTREGPCILTGPTVGCLPFQQLCFLPVPSTFSRS